MNQTVNGAESNEFHDEAFRGSHYLLRDESIDILKVISHISKSPSASVPTRHIHLYCDKLVFSGIVNNGEATLELSGANSALQSVHIYARSVFLAEKIQVLRFQGIDSLYIRVFFDLCPPGLQIATEKAQCGIFGNDNIVLDTGDGDEERALAREVEEFMKIEESISCVGREIMFNLSEANCQVLNNVCHLEVDGWCGSLAYSPMESRFLPTLLNILFDAASAKLFTNSRNVVELISTYRFILYCSRNSSRLAMLYESTRALLDRLDVPLRYPGLSKLGEGNVSLRLDVPVLTSKRLFNQLEDELQGVQQLENQLDMVRMKEETLSAIGDLKQDLQKDLRVMTETFSTAISKTVVSFTDLHNLETEMLEANEDVKKKQLDMKNASDGVKQSQKEFTLGVKKYEDDQRSKLKWEVIKALGEITFSIGITIFTMGAGGPATAKTVYDAVNGIKTAVSKMDKIMALLKKLAELVIKLGPRLYGAAKQTTSNLAVASSAKGDATLHDASTLILQKTPPGVNQPLDYLGMMADWEELKITVDAVFHELERDFDNEKIQGMTPYRSALRKLCVRGQTALNAQRVAQEAMSKYYRALAEKTARDARSNEIQKMGKALVGPTSKDTAQQALSTLKDDYRRQLVVTKRNILVSFYDCFTSVMYENSSTKYPPIRVTSTLSIAEYLSARAALGAEANAAAKKRQGGSQRPSKAVVLDTAKDLNKPPETRIFHEGWQSLLKTEHKLFFDFTSEAKIAGLTQLAKYYRVRLETVKISFTGLKPKGDQATIEDMSLSYGVFLGPQFVDRSPDKKLIQYTMFNAPLMGSLDCATLQTEGDGKWSGDENETYVYPPLFCRGCVFFGPEAEEFDFDSVTGCQIMLGVRANVFVMTM